jgi:hypothetical protein
LLNSVVDAAASCAAVVLPNGISTTSWSFRFPKHLQEALVVLAGAMHVW